MSNLTSSIVAMVRFTTIFFVVAINTGLRIGEMAALTWDDIDLKIK